MFRLPDNLPTENSSISELADFIEILALKTGAASQREIEQYLSQPSDNDYNIGCEDSDVEIEGILDEALNEIDTRKKSCGNDCAYPFNLQNSAGTVCRLSYDETNPQNIAYIYLLLSTRFNMSDNRKHAEIDGSLLLEELSAEALKTYLGAERAESLVFGTATSGGFKEKINDLCGKIGEGAGYGCPDGAVRHTQDGKLDAVGWIPFSDANPGKLIVFGQCKTGTSWHDSVAQLQPSNFIKKFMSGSLHLDPVRAFFVSEAINPTKRNGLSIDAGILFDRCRIVDFCGEFSPELVDKLKSWVHAAKETINI